jgi:hypothetical protein
MRQPEDRLGIQKSLFSEIKVLSLFSELAFAVRVACKAGPSNYFSRNLYYKIVRY